MSYGVMISTADFDSASPSLNLGSSTCTKSWCKWEHCEIIVDPGSNPGDFL